MDAKADKEQATCLDRGWKYVGVLESLKSGLGFRVCMYVRGLGFRGSGEGEGVGSRGF